MYFSHLIFLFVLYSSKAGGAFLGNYGPYRAPNGSLTVHQPADWRKARLECFTKGAMLASPENFELYVAMLEAVNERYDYVFTGVHNTFSNLYFNSLEGTPLNQLAAYGEDEIKSDNEDSCLKMNKYGYLFTSECTEKLPYICYKKNPIIRDVINNPMDNLDCGIDGYTLSRETSSRYKFHKEYVYWHQAFAACAIEGAHLAIINSEEESQVLKELFLRNQGGRETKTGDAPDVVHIGFVDWGKEGGLWMTIDGQTIQSAGFAEWSNKYGVQEPNNRTNQFCGGMFDDGKFDDVNCGDGDPGHLHRSFICEKKPNIRTVINISYNN